MEQRKHCPGSTHDGYINQPSLFKHGYSNDKRIPTRRELTESFGQVEYIEFDNLRCVNEDIDEDFMLAASTCNEPAKQMLILSNLRSTIPYHPSPNSRIFHLVNSVTCRPFEGISYYNPQVPPFCRPFDQRAGELPLNYSGESPFSQP